MSRLATVPRDVRTPRLIKGKGTRLVSHPSRETCRDVGVPLLVIGPDVFEYPYTTTGEIKDKFTNFLRTMGLG